MIRRIAYEWKRLSARSRAARARLVGIELGAHTLVEPAVDFGAGIPGSHYGSILSGERCYVSRGCVLHTYGGRIALGQHVVLGPYVVIYGHAGVEIGDHSLIAMHCRILSSNHAIPPPGTLIRSQPDVLLPTRIGRDVWLGAGVTVLGGVTIGDGCIVGAGAVVTRDLPPNAIAVGCPAKVLRYRT